MDIKPHPDGTNLRRANKALREKMYAQAIELYAKAILESENQTPGILDNLAIAQSRHLQERRAFQNLRIGVCGWELSHNAAGRAYTLAQLYQELGHEVKIIGTQLPGYGDGQIWEPIRNSQIPISSVKIDGSPLLISQLMNLVIANPFDVVHLSKPRITNIIFALLYKLIWQSKVIVDIDDEELTFVGATQSISPDQYLKTHQHLPPLEHVDKQPWTQMAVSLAKEFDAITVSGPTLADKYSGQIIRHARNENDFKKIARYRQSTREQFDIPEDKKVILFFGTPRNHKGLLEIADAISDLQDANMILVIVGSFPPETAHIKQELKKHQKFEIKFIENQPFDTIPKVLSVADYYVIWQDEDSPVSAYQVPAKLSDALAANIPILINQTPAIQDLIGHGAFFVADKKSLSRELASMVSNKTVDKLKQSKASSLFASEFSFSANLLRLKNTLESATQTERELSLTLQHFGGKLDSHISHFFIKADESQVVGRVQNHPDFDLESYKKLYLRYQVINQDQIHWDREATKSRIKGLTSIVIPIYGQDKLTEQCVHSIFKHTNQEQFELILVDNGSDTHTKEALKRLCSLYSRIKLHTNSENLQFALGNNLGFTHANGEFLVCLNNDTEVSVGWLKPLIDSLSLPQVAIAQPKLLYPNGNIQCIGIVFSEKSTLGYPIYANKKPDNLWANKSRPFQAVTGACMAMRAIDFITAKGFDPVFINGQEDVDLCLRITQNQNRHCWYESSSIVVHKESQTPNRHTYTTKNRETFIDRWKFKTIPDDFKYYEADGFIAKNYEGDRPNQATAIFRPILEQANAKTSHFAAKEQRSNFSITDGMWKIVGRNIEGWIISDQPQQIDLVVLIDQKPIHELAVMCKQNESTQFHFQIPIKWLDATSHIVEIKSKIHKKSIRYIEGDLKAAFNKQVPYAIDSIDHGMIKGWAFDFQSPHESIPIELYDGATKIGEVTTQLKRGDVNELYGITGNHGFEIAIPAKQFNNIFHTLKIISKGELLAPDSNKVLSQKLSPSLINQSPSRYQGVVEDVSPEIITGWALDRLDPRKPAQVEIYIDGIYQATLTANRFQKRFIPLSDFGYHGFRYEFPTNLMNSSKRKIEVKFSGSSENLEFKATKTKSADVFFPLIDFFYPYQIIENEVDFTQGLPNNLLPRAYHSSTKTNALLSIIVLNWNGANLLKQLLQSLDLYVDQENVEVIVVDHGSDDESQAIVNRYVDTINLRWVNREKNYSFSDSNNFAANLASGEHLLFLNNDIVFFQDSLKLLQEQLIHDPSIGIIGMQLVEPIPVSDKTWHFDTHHRGIAFAPKRTQSGSFAYLPHEIADHYAALGSSFELLAVTAAALMCRKSDFLAINGFNESYFYGLEDVDFCLRMHQQLKKRIICDSSSHALHNRGYTRSAKLVSKNTNPISENRISQSNNESIFLSQTKTSLSVEILKSLIDGNHALRLKPLRVTFVVTDASSNTPAGDFYTAMEMALALQKFGWETLFVKKDMGHIPGTDILIVMRHDYDLRKIQDANPGIVIIAWIRNRLNQWIESPFFQDYHLFFCSSQLAVNSIKEQTTRDAYLLPIATNELRFSPTQKIENKSLDIVFTGSYWGAERDAVNLFADINATQSFAIYGYGWEKHPTLGQYWRESVPYENLNEVYNQAKIVIDDSHPVTREFNSLNSRIFDSIAAGSLVVTNCTGGANELFGDALPTFDTANELNALLSTYLENTNLLLEKTASLREIVLNKHTYTHRAEFFKSTVAHFLSNSIRFSIKIGIPGHEVKETWGDWHFALGIQKALIKLGHVARIDILPEWYTPLSAGDDVVIVLQGLSIYKPNPEKINLLWLISHPNLVKIEELATFDHVFVASTIFAEKLQKDFAKEKVSALLQCTDPELFHPPSNPRKTAGILFIGNSRGTNRPIVDLAIACGCDPSIYGSKWKGIIADHYIKGEYIANTELFYYYSSAKVVLNDHWSDMREFGFISNRLFDAGACGASILSDDILGLEEVFMGHIAHYASEKEFKEKIRALNGSQQTPLNEALIQLVKERHTFDHRASKILSVIAQIKQKLII